MTDYKIWKPEHVGHAPPNWRDGMKWTLQELPLAYDAVGNPDWDTREVYCVEPEALNSPNDDASEGKPTDPRKSVHEALAILRDYSPDELAKHGITLAPELDWATELWAELVKIRDPGWWSDLMEGDIEDEDIEAIELLRHRFEQMIAERSKRDA